MNRENIKIVRDHLASLSESRFNMNIWSASANGTWRVDPPDLQHTCGSVACIGGWTNAVFKAPIASLSHASDVLGLSSKQAEELFFMDYVDGPFYDHPDLSNVAMEQATIHDAIEVLDRFLETGEVQWPEVMAGR